MDLASVLFETRTLVPKDKKKQTRHEFVHLDVDLVLFLLSIAQIKMRVPFEFVQCQHGYDPK
jgi:hypothetical protein